MPLTMTNLLFIPGFKHPGLEREVYVAELCSGLDRFFTDVKSGFWGVKKGKTRLTNPFRGKVEKPENLRVSSCCFHNRKDLFVSVTVYNSSLVVWEAVSCENCSVLRTDVSLSIDDLVPGAHLITVDYSFVRIVGGFPRETCLEKNSFGNDS